MKELVFKGESNQVLTNSLLVAEKFGKEHKRVMQDIRELKCSNQFKQHNFVLSSYKSEQNRELPMYVMNKDGFTLLVMGYTGEIAMKFKEEYIKAFNEMEEIIKNGSYCVPKSFREALLLAAEQQAQIEQQQMRIEEMKPKKKYKIGNFEVQCIPVPHGDCPCYSFIIDNPDMGRMLFITDVSDFPYKIKGVNHLFIEANYMEDIILDNACNNKWNSSASNTHMGIEKSAEVIKRHYSEPDRLNSLN